MRILPAFHAASLALVLACGTAETPAAAAAAGAASGPFEFAGRYSVSGTTVDTETIHAVPAISASPPDRV